MALLNRFFPSKKKNFKQGYVSSGRNEFQSWKPFNFTREQVRLLLFRECDARGRKLLFDSSAVQRTVLETQQCSKLKIGSKPKCDSYKKADTYVEVTNGIGYQYTRPNSDVTLVGEMIFGSVAMTFKGMTCKVHSMKSPDRFMCSRVFHAPAVQVDCKRRSDQSIESSGSSVSSVNDSLLSLSGNYETRLTLNNSSCPLEVPRSDTCARTVINSLEGDSGFCGDSSLRSISSVGSGYWSPFAYFCDSQRASHSTLGNGSNSGGSLSSLHRRLMKNLTTSLELGMTYSPWQFVRGRTSELTDEVSRHMHRKTQLGLTVLISVAQNEEKDMELFFFEHMAIIEGMLERLQYNVEKAYLKKDVFVHLMMDAFLDLQQWLCDLFTAPRLVCPVWIGLANPNCSPESSRFQHAVATTFMRDFCQLIAAIDTKATNFFVSTLVTAVLTHHLSWVATIMPVKAPATNVTKPPCAVQMLHAMAKSHPYNPLWAQLGDLHGALGNPVKIARTIVTANAKKTDILNKLLTSLSYFIRCGNIEKRIDSQVIVDNESATIDSVMQNLQFVNTNSDTESTSIVVPENSMKLERCGSDTLISQNRIVNSYTETLNEKSEKKEVRESFLNQKENSEILLRSSLADAHGAVRFKKSATFVNCLNILSEVKNTNFSDSSNPQVHDSRTNSDNSFLHPDVISEKVSRLCRVPTSAVLYHMKNDVDNVNNFLPKKVDCEKQLASMQSEKREGCVLPVGSLEDSPKKCDSGASNSGVIFLLGDNERLVDLQSQNRFNIPKIKSDDISGSDTLKIKANEFKTSNAYTTSEGSLCSPNNHQSLNINASHVQKDNLKLHRNESLKERENKIVNSSILNNTDSNRKYFLNNCGERFSDSSLVLQEQTFTKNISDELGSNEADHRKKGRTRKSVYENQFTGSLTNLMLQDINGNSWTDENEINHSCKVVTSHSFVIELEDVHCANDRKTCDVDRKFVKQVSRSQSLSFPDRKSVSLKKTVGVCRRHSENMHPNERYLRDYHSVRFNFERCYGVLTDYVGEIGLEKSPQMDKKSIKVCEARENFELQDKVCDKCKLRKPDICQNAVLSNHEMCSCVSDIAFSKKYAGEGKTLGNAETHSREGNALFDEYGIMSDDELFSSTDVSVGRELKVAQKEEVHQPSFTELPLPWCSSNQHEQCLGLSASLMGSVCDHYMPDMVLHGCTQPLAQWEATLKRDLTLSAHHPMLDHEVSEAVCIVANAELWEVQLISSHTSIVDKPGGFGIRVGMSQLVANMLESLLHLWKLRTPPEQCLMHLESKLRELCLRSQALAEFLLTTELCDMTMLTSSLGLEANDVPLLMAIASTHSPQVTNLYGLSFQ